MIKQSLEQKLEQKLTPQQIQMIKLLELPILELEQRVKQELEDNPALEADSEDNFSDETELMNDDDDKPTDANEDEFSVEDYIGDDDEIPYYKLQINNNSKDDNYKEIPYSEIKSFQDSLVEQLQMKQLTETSKVISNYLLGTLDEDGYIRRENEQIANDIAFKENIEVSELEVEETIKILQELDPAGIGARDLKECLNIQIERRIKDIIENEENSSLEEETTVSQPLILAKRIIQDYFEEISKKHYDKIMNKMSISETELKSAIDVILTLNPLPGNSFSDSKAVNHYSIIPDFIIEIDNGELIVTLNDKNTPDLRISENFAGMIKKLKSKNQSSKEAVQFIRQKIESAKWFIDAISQRQNTLLLTINAIANIQKEFFLSGDERNLKPMVLKNISEITGLDISTISRVANSKYLSTPYGTYLLKYFFSEAMQTDSGDEVSSREVKTILKDCVANEDKQKPLTDDKLMELLNQRGYQIARRTIAKYREQLDIPVSRLRKELK